MIWQKIYLVVDRKGGLFLHMSALCIQDFKILV